MPVTILRTKAKPLERAMFEFEFDNGGKEGVLEALEAYRNEDGGFGKGIEPDFRCAASFALYFDKKRCLFPI